MSSRSVMLLLACLLVACHSRQGTLTLAAAVHHHNSHQFYDLTPIGISFVPSDTAQQQQQAIDNNNKTDNELERLEVILAPRLSDTAAALAAAARSESRQQQQQQQHEEDEHRDLAKRTYSRDSVIRELIKLIDDSLKARLTPQTSSPIIRNGRTYPSPISAAAAAIDNDKNTQHRQQQGGATFLGNGIRFIGGKNDGLPSSGGGDQLAVVPATLPVGSSKSRLLGLKFNDDGKSATAAAVVTPYYLSNMRQQQQQQQQQRQHSTQAGVNQISNSNNRNSHHLTPSMPITNSQIFGSTVGEPSGGNAISVASPSPFHHRRGTEEVALHTPIHSSLPDSDYEFKRVENSRWNNLRGMWGKRAISERYNNLENFKNMLDAEARESLADTTSNNNDLVADNNENNVLKNNNQVYREDANGDDDGGDGQQQQQQQRIRQQRLLPSLAM